MSLCGLGWRAILKASVALSVFMMAVVDAESGESATVSTAQKLLDTAMKEGAGKTLILSHELTSKADPSVLHMTKLPGDTKVRIIGATDFVACSPNLPNDVELDSSLPVSFINADGKEVKAAPSSPVDPVVMLAGNLDQFPGPELQRETGAIPVPFDYDKEGHPQGLRIADSKGRTLHTANRLRHLTEHDGYIIWVAEYRLLDGTTKVTWDELPMTRAKYPTFKPRLSVVSGTNIASHLLKLVTLQVSTADEMVVASKGDSDDPRRWTLQPKRLRSFYKPDRILAATDGGISLREIRKALLEIPIDSSGGVKGIVAGKDYVIEIPPVVVGVISKNASGEPGIMDLGDDGVGEHLSKLKKNRIFLIGTPGKTIFPSLDITGVQNIDFGWISVTPVERRKPYDGLLLIKGMTDVRFFGCVIDDVDYSSFGAGDIFGGKIKDKYVQGGWMEFYDGYYGGSEGPTLAWSSIGFPLYAVPRLILARSVLDFSNDGVSVYGQGIARVESNYFYGAGGRWNERSGTYQHRDILGQIGQTIPDLAAVAYYNNIVCMGPNLVGNDLAIRASGSLLMYQPVCDYGSEITGNILENNLAMRGITGMHEQREPISGKTGERWTYGMHIAQNLIYERPDNVATGLTYPTCVYGGVRGGNADTWVGTSNLVPYVGREFEVNGFARSINWFPESVNGAKATWITLSGYKLDKRTGRVNGGILSGGNSGAHASVYGMERKGADGVFLVGGVEGEFKPEEDVLCNGFFIGKFASVIQKDGFKGNRADYPAVASVLPKFPKISGSMEKEYSMDYSNTTYAGTSRERYLSPRDFEVSQTLRRFSTDGKSGGPGLPFYGDYLKKFRELPANFNKDLLGYDIPGSGYPDDWYESWAPKPFKLKGVLNNPWKPAPGESVVADKELLVNTRIETLGSGTLAEETADDGSMWRLEILADRTYRPRFTLKDKSGKILYELTSAKSIAAKQRLLVGVSTQHRSYSLEYQFANKLIQRYIWKNVGQKANKDAICLTLKIQATPPDAQDTPGGSETILWVDTSDGNRSKILQDRKWVYLQGDLSAFMPCFLGRLAIDEGTYISPYMGCNTLPQKTLHLFLAVSPEKFLPSVVPAEGDIVIYAKPNGLAFNVDPAVMGKYKSGAWVEDKRIPHTNMYTMHGDIRCYFRINSEESIREPEWIWSNTQQDFDAAQYYVPGPALSGREKKFFKILQPGRKEISAGFMMRDAHHLELYKKNMAGEQRHQLVLDKDYTVTNLGEGNKGLVILTTPVKENEYYTVVPAIPAEASIDYGFDHVIPRGNLKLGANAANPFTGTVNFFEARRQRGHSNEHLSIEVPCTGVEHRFGRRPIDPKTGARDTPLLPAADVWVVAE